MTEYIVQNEHGRFTIVRDHQYGFWRVSPPPTEHFLNRFYQNTYHNPTYSFHDQLYLDFIRRRAPHVLTTEGPVLEVGCGNGDKLLAFQSAGLEVYGFEPGTADYNACQTKGLNVFNQTFDVSTASQYGPYSLILLTNILEHLPYPENFLAELSPLLQRTGVLLINVPNDFNAFQELFRANTKSLPWFLSPPAHLNYFTPTTLTTLLEDKGWIVRHRTTRFPMELFLLMGRHYVAHPELGKAAHLERVEFENSFLGGNEDILWRFYDSLAQAELGREVIVLCDKADAASDPA